MTVLGEIQAIAVCVGSLSRVDSARLQLLTDLNYNFTVQQVVNLKQYNAV